MRFASTVPSLLIASLFTLACGDDDSSSPDASSTEPAATATAQPNDPTGVDPAPIASGTGSPQEPAAPQNIVELAVATDDLSTLVTAVQAADLAETLSTGGPYTVLAPTNAAFDALPAGALDALLADRDALTNVLLHHVIEGEVLSTDLPGVVSAKSLAGQTLLIDTSDGASFSGARVTTPDVGASNGVVHVIDTVLLPPTQNIVEVAIDNPDFSTLVAAVTAAGLADTLSGEGPFTVFAPTNAAFDALPAGTLDALLADPAALTNVLLYHVVDGEVLSGNLPGVDSAPTLLEGRSLDVDLSDGVSIGGANVTAPDVLTTNGVIHVIDTVLVP